MITWRTKWAGCSGPALLASPTTVSLSTIGAAGAGTEDPLCTLTANSEVWSTFPCYDNQNSGSSGDGGNRSETSSDGKSDVYTKLRFGIMLYNTNLYENGISFKLLKLHSENSVLDTSFTTNNCSGRSMLRMDESFLAAYNYIDYCIIRPTADQHTRDHRILSYDVIVDLYVQVNSTRFVENRGIAFNVKSSSDYDFIDFRFGKNLNTISWRVGYRFSNMTVFTSRLRRYGEWKYTKYNFTVDTSAQGVWFRVKVYVRNKLSIVGIQYISNNVDYIENNYKDSLEMPKTFNLSKLDSLSIKGSNFIIIENTFEALDRFALFVNSSQKDLSDLNELIKFNAKIENIKSSSKNIDIYNYDDFFSLKNNKSSDKPTMKLFPIDSNDGSYNFKYSIFVTPDFNSVNMIYDARSSQDFDFISFGQNSSPCNILVGQYSRNRIHWTKNPDCVIESTVNKTERVKVVYARQWRSLNVNVKPTSVRFQLGNDPTIYNLRKTSNLTLETRRRKAGHKHVKRYTGILSLPEKRRIKTHMNLRAAVYPKENDVEYFKKEIYADVLYSQPFYDYVLKYRAIDCAYQNPTNDQDFIFLDGDMKIRANSDFCRVISPTKATTIMNSFSVWQMAKKIEAKKSATLGIMFNTHSASDYEFILLVIPDVIENFITTGYFKANKLMASKNHDCNLEYKMMNWYKMELTVNADVAQFRVSNQMLLQFYTHYPSIGNYGMITYNVHQNLNMFKKDTTKDTNSYDKQLSSQNCQGSPYLPSTMENRANILMLYTSPNTNSVSRHCLVLFPIQSNFSDFLSGYKFEVWMRFWRNVEGSATSGEVGVAYNVLDSHNFEYILLRKNLVGDCIEFHYKKEFVNHVHENANFEPSFCKSIFPELRKWFKVRIEVNRRITSVFINNKFVVEFISSRMDYNTYSAAGVLASHQFTQSFHFSSPKLTSLMYAQFPSKYHTKNCSKNDIQLTRNQLYFLDTGINQPYQHGYCQLNYLSQLTRVCYSAEIKLLILFGKGGFYTSTIGFMFNIIDDDNYEFVSANLHSKTNCFKTGSFKNGFEKIDLQGSCNPKIFSRGDKQHWITMKISLDSSYIANFTIDNHLIVSFKFTSRCKTRVSVIIRKDLQNLLLFKDVYVVRQMETQKTNSSARFQGNCYIRKNLAYGETMLHSSISLLDNGQFCIALHDDNQDWPNYDLTAVQRTIVNLDQGLNGKGVVGVMFNVFDEQSYDYLVIKVGSSFQDCFIVGSIRKGIHENNMVFGKCPYGSPEAGKTFKITVQVRSLPVVTLLLDDNFLADVVVSHQGIARVGAIATIGHNTQLYYSLNIKETISGMCSRKPCLNAGECIESMITNWYFCKCLFGYSGVHCQLVLNKCMMGITCNNGGTCIQIVNEGPTICKCRRSFEGKYCNIKKEVCYSHPCMYNGTCVVKRNRYICECKKGFTGINCENIINNCLNHKCIPSARCINKVADYACTCGHILDKSVRTLCLIKSNMSHMLDIGCKFDSCFNGATCKEIGQEVKCFCKPGYNSHRCSHEINECDSTPCINNSTCLDKINGYQCFCKQGYNGQFCQYKLPYTCMPMPCLNNGKCVHYGLYARCLCSAGFTGPICEYDFDPCNSYPCQHEADCSFNRGADIVCKCKYGYHGRLCAFKKDYCKNKPCLHSGTCINAYTSYKCFCSYGYLGSRCELSLNTCISNPCTNGSTCLNHIDSYSCICLPGIEGPNCQRVVDGCLQNPCLHGSTCLPSAFGHGYECKCMPGYAGTKCEHLYQPCFTKPCYALAACFRVGLDDFSCQCPQGRGGKRCEIKIIECPQNLQCGKSKCGFDEIAKEEKCVCKHGFYGPGCMFIEDFQCINSICENGGSCQFIHEYSSNKVCKCLPEYTGVVCSEYSFMMASKGKCQNGGSPLTIDKCVCSMDFTGKYCERKLIAMSCQNFRCQNKGICKEYNKGKSECLCLTPHTGIFCELWIHSDNNQEHICNEQNTCPRGKTCVINYKIIEGYSCVQLHQETTTYVPHKKIQNLNRHLIFTILLSVSVVLFILGVVFMLERFKLKKKGNQPEVVDYRMAMQKFITHKENHFIFEGQ